MKPNYEYWQVSPTSWLQLIVIHYWFFLIKKNGKRKSTVYIIEDL